MNDRRVVRKKRRKIKVSHVLIALLLAAVAAFAIFRVKTRFELKARIDAVRAAGYPVTSAELDQWYKIPPDAENAAYTIEEAFLFYKDWDKERSKPLPIVGGAKLRPRTEPLRPEMKALRAEYIADHNEALELLHAGAAIEDCRYPIDLTAGFAAQMPNVGEIRKGVKLLELDAVLHAENGDGRLAVRSAISGFGIARSLAREPLIISQLVRASCQGSAISAVEQIVNRTELTDEQLLELIETVREGERISDMSCAFVGERCIGISFFKDPEHMGPEGLGGTGPLFRVFLGLYKSVGLADADAVIHLDLMDGNLKAAQLPLHERQQAVEAVEATFQSTSKAHVLLHQTMPALARVTSLETRAIARLRTAEVGLAIQRYRLATGTLPGKLSDLAPTYLESVTKDPFDGNELRYRKLDSGFVVYSVGEDLSDDGGKEKPARRKSGQEPPKWDVIFVVER